MCSHVVDLDRDRVGAWFGEEAVGHVGGELDAVHLDVALAEGPGRPIGPGIAGIDVGQPLTAGGTLIRGGQLTMLNPYH